MADLRKFQIKFFGYSAMVLVLEVDYDILTEEHASEINAFTAGGLDRLIACEGDVRAAVIRDAGASFGDLIIRADTGYFSVDDCSRLTDALYSIEGWGSYEYTGIRLVSVDEVPVIDFWSAEVEEVANG